MTGLRDIGFDGPFNFEIPGERGRPFDELLETLDRIGPGGPRDGLGAIDGLAWRHEDNAWVTNTPRRLRPSLDDLPMPARHLAERYASQYFFLVA